LDKHYGLFGRAVAIGLHFFCESKHCLIFFNCPPPWIFLETVVLTTKEYTGGRVLHGHGYTACIIKITVSEFKLTIVGCWQYVVCTETSTNWCLIPSTRICTRQFWALSAIYISTGTICTILHCSKKPTLTTQQSKCKYGVGQNMYGKQNMFITNSFITDLNKKYIIYKENCQEIVRVRVGINGNTRKQCMLKTALRPWGLGFETCAWKEVSPFIFTYLGSRLRGRMRMVGKWRSFNAPV